MLVLFALVSRSLCYFCRHSFQITTNTPQYFTVEAVEGDYLCVNSSLPHLAILFEQRALLNVRAFEQNDDNGLVQKGKFEFPGNTVGVVFGDDVGHVEAMAVIGGNVSFAVFAFPEECASNKYISTLSDDEFILKSVFKAQDERACFWVPHMSWSLYDIPATAESREAIKKCEPTCSDAINEDGADVAVTVKSSQFVEIDLSNPGFVEDFNVKLAVKKPRKWFKVAQSFRTPSQPEGVKLLSVMGEAGEMDGADNSLNGNENGPRERFGRRHGEWRPGRRNGEPFVNTVVTLEIISVISVIVAGVLLIVQCFLCRMTQQKKSRARDDDSEDRLLAEYQEGRYPIPSPQQLHPGPYAFPQGYLPSYFQPGMGYSIPASQYAVTQFPGVVFPVATAQPQVQPQPTEQQAEIQSPGA